MRNLLYVVPVALILFGCSAKADKVIVSEEVPAVEEAVVHANQLLSMEVDGMVCQMGCGGSIRKALKGTGAVSNIEFDFEDERATNVATISFDKNKVTQDELVKLVSDLNDGQFTVGEVSSEALSKEIVHEDHDHSSAETHEVEMSSSNFQMPNLLDLLSGLLPN